MIISIHKKTCRPKLGYALSQLVRREVEAIRLQCFEQAFLGNGRSAMMQN
jgi:hypothetical protein